jgi:hypothetical protein
VNGRLVVRQYQAIQRGNEPDLPRQTWPLEAVRD